jgi:hypothetical protein
MDVWLSDTLRRYYVSSEAESTRALTLEAARGERLSFQVLCRTGWTDALIATQVTAPDGLAIEVRRAGYVPMPHFSRVYKPGTVIRDASPAAADIEGWGHVPGLAPDPLFPETSVRAGLCETHAFWVTVRVSSDLAPGAYAVTTVVTGADDVQTLTVTVRVHRARLESRRDFPVTHWFYPDAFCSWYKIAPFEDAFWRLLDPYLANMARTARTRCLCRSSTRRWKVRAAGRSCSTCIAPGIPTSSIGRWSIAGCGPREPRV